MQEPDVAATLDQFLQSHTAGMLGAQVHSDLGLSDVPLNTKTPWGLQTFRARLLQCQSSAAAIRKQQLPLLALRANPALSATLQAHLTGLRDIGADIDACLDTAPDPRIVGASQQILWSPSSYGAWLNCQERVLHTVHAWKTLVLPLTALLVPILAVVVPFFAMRILRPATAPSLGTYARSVFSTIKTHAAVPPFLQAKHSSDWLGHGIEALFVAFTVAMFVSGIWNQIHAAKHLRSVYADLSRRGSVCTRLYETCRTCVSALRTSLSPRHQRAVSDIIDRGECALEAAAALACGGISAYGAVWNTPTVLEDLKAWISQLDVLVAIACTPNICFPVCGDANNGLVLTKVQHPCLPDCVSNTLSLNDKGPYHAILTGPNRGGKSTFCRAVGIAIVTAQSWGFAWADSMSFTPFAHIVTALEGAGRLGIYSTFEAEIAFAKSVLDISATPSAPICVIMDEIFHATNARDGLEASRVFLDRLYEKKDGSCVSIISTHYSELPARYGKGDAICLQAVARMRDDDSVAYTYQIAPGVSTISSVRELLRERGLMLAHPVGDQQTAELSSN